MSNYYDNKINKLMKSKARKELLEKGQIQCSKCDEIKEINLFDKINPKLNDKRRKDCKVCRKLKNAEYYKSKNINKDT